MLLYKKTCVSHCPDKYEANNATINQCILVGLQCPDGFYVNAAGDGCVPKVFECKPGYVINAKRTACIPGPGTPVPFPFLFLAGCMSLVVAGSYMKDKKATKVRTCLIWLISSMEPLEYLLIAIFAATLEKVLASAFAFIAVLMLIASNLAFYVYYRRYTVHDRAFADWIRLYPRTQYSLPLACSVINMKLIRFSYSGFFSWDVAEARFTDPI